MTTKENAPLRTGRTVHHNFLDTTNYNTADAVTQFQDAMMATGLSVPNSIIPDGKIHRFSTNDRSSDKAGWYVLHVDGLPAGAFGDCRTDISEHGREQSRRGRGHDPTPQVTHT